MEIVGSLLMMLCSILSWQCPTWQRLNANTSKFQHSFSNDDTKTMMEALIHYISFQLEHLPEYYVHLPRCWVKGQIDVISEWCFLSVWQGDGWRLWGRSVSSLPWERLSPMGSSSSLLLLAYNASRRGSSKWLCRSLRSYSSDRRWTSTSLLWLIPSLLLTSWSCRCTGRTLWYIPDHGGRTSPRPHGSRSW